MLDEQQEEEEEPILTQAHPSVTRMDLAVINQANDPNKRLRCIACDPGTVNFALCHLEYCGSEYIKNEQGQLVKMPLFNILNWALLDLKRKIIYQYDPENVILVKKLNEKPQIDESYLGLTTSLAECLVNLPWLFETYQYDGEETLPILATELQCGAIKNDELDVTLMSYILPGVIEALDRKQEKPKRLILNRARKYGLPSDGELTYAQRKAKSEEITRSLLFMSKKLYLIRFLAAFRLARKRDIQANKLPQTHDLCDAYVLGLETSREIAEQMEKQLQKEAAQSSSLIVIPDQEVQAAVSSPEWFVPDINEKRTNRKNKWSLSEISEKMTDALKKRKVDSDEEDDEDTPMKKKRKQPEKKEEPRKLRPSSLLEISEEIYEDLEKAKKRRLELAELPSDEEVEILETPRKKRAKRTPPAEKKYKQLELIL